MYFENVDVLSLRNALTQCKNTINHAITNELINNLANDAVWQSDAKTNLKNALSTLNNERYQELEKTIDRYLELVSCIERYQNLQKENETLTTEYSNLASRLYRTETYTSGTGKKAKTETVTVKDTGVETNMSNVNNRINQNSIEMENLKNTVANSI